MVHLGTFNPSLTALAWIVAGVALGFVLDRTLIARLKRAAEKTPIKGDDVILSALKGMPLFWFTLLGLNGAILSLAFKESFAEMIQKGLVVAFIFSLTWMGSRIAAGMVDLFSKRAEGILPSTSIFTNLTRLLVFVVGILVIMQSLGISITPILTALGVGGLAVALALQDTLSNLFAGLQIILARQLKPGDYVQLDSGEEGYVEDINWRNTTLRTLPNNTVIIPNAKLSGAVITNYSKPQMEMACLVSVGVSYDSDLEKVEQVTIEVGKEVMREVTGGVPSFEPFIRYHTFGDSRIDFTVILRGQEFVSQYLLKHEFVKRLHARYKREGIEIPFPIRTLYVRNGLQMPSAS